MIKYQLPHMGFDQISDDKDDMYFNGKLCSNLLPQTANKNTTFTGNDSFLKVGLSSSRKKIIYLVQ